MDAYRAMRSSIGLHESAEVRNIIFIVAIGNIYDKKNI